jgi:hypothetical protein
MFKISEAEVLKALKAFEEKSSQLENVIRPFLSQELSSKKATELCHVGKLINLLDKPSEILVQDESPDFIISYDGNKIGLEHSKIVIKDKVKSIKSLNKLFDDSADYFKLKYPDLNVLANCYLTTNNFSYKQDKVPELKHNIATYIYGLITNDHSVEKPYFIEDVDWMDHSDVSFCYNPGGFCVTNLDTKPLIDAIKHKERLITKYREKSGLKNQWLLLVIGSSSPDSYEVRHELNIDIKSEFERIYLLEDFSTKLLRIS